MIPGTGTLTVTTAGLVYWRKAKKEIDQLIEEERYEELVELHQESVGVKELLSGKYEDINEGNWKISSPQDILSTSKNVAYGFAFTDEKLEKIYREFLEEQGLDEIYIHL